MLTVDLNVTAAAVATVPLPPTPYLDCALPSGLSYLWLQLSKQRVQQRYGILNIPVLPF